MPTEETIRVAKEVRAVLAGKALTERQAKLYSQRLRREMGREGLASFSSGDVAFYLDEAMLLLHCALIERSAEPNSAWREGVKRAAEIFEWLSQSDLKPKEVPMYFLAAAAYQLAGYPAMALGHLRRMPNNEQFSFILREFLSGNFPATLEAVRVFWKDQRSLEVDNLILPSDLSVLTIRHTVLCIGTVCSYLRTGADGMVERALRKLDSIASSFLHSYDQFSYMLAQLTAITCRSYVETSLWPRLAELRSVSTPRASDAFIQFGRTAFVNRRALVWPAQASGIVRLLQNTSFVLCTPTGSGKTTVATLAIVQGLYAEPTVPIRSLEAFDSGNLILYLVPSRALAAEVEGRLAQDLHGIAAEPIIVTGLYGGVDWGPTDAWIQTEKPTIVICTFEKADALLRYLGVLFLNRVRLVIIDEAHMVEQDANRLEGLEDGASRSYRLEQLGSRILHAQDTYGFRLLALSAVAARAAPALARWISGDANASAITSDYRSTRQMLGRLEVSATGQFTIRYDLMDGRSLKFEDERQEETPYVLAPFPPLPGGIDPDAGPEIAMRAPTLWAALHLAAERSDGARPSVLISLTQSVETFAANCADLLERWPAERLPRYRAEEETDDRWTRCLASAADYFTTESVEYRLLKRGIAVHHGNMPGLLARRLKVLIDCGYVRVIIATSTLSEGVNIPVNYLLIPNLFRGVVPISLQEFTNLIGRVGRAGIATEGHAFIVLPEQTHRGKRLLKRNRQWEGYRDLTIAIEQTTLASGGGVPEDSASSPLWHLLTALENAWRDLTRGGTAEEFTNWLERTAVTDEAGEIPIALRYLDSLDAFLLASIHEIEELRNTELTPDAIEEELIRVWQRTYAFASAHDETRLRRIWLDRGKTIKERYPDAGQRRRIYKTSLAPRSALVLVNHADTIKEKLLEGAAYASWDIEQRFIFVRDVLHELSRVPSFRITTTLGRSRNFTDWPKLLRWWLSKSTLTQQPEPGKITSWYEFVSRNFIYRGAWGLGSIIGLLLGQDDSERPIRALEIEDWPRSGLPWIAFWLKELLTWGTLDPVAAFLLARGNTIDRQRAETEAQEYYLEHQAIPSPNDMLDPRIIRNWLDARRIRPQEITPRTEFSINVELEREYGEYLMERLTVMPIDVNDRLVWIDSAGYSVARSAKPREWPQVPSAYEFELSVRDGIVLGTAYLPYN